MQRIHISLTVADLDQSINFYTTLLGHAPTTQKPDYAKWMLDDPRVNLSLSTHGTDYGFDHLGLQVEDAAEFETVSDRATRAADDVFEQPDVTCCYARSSKAWVRDPDGVAWESFLSHSQTTGYSDSDIERAGGAVPAPPTHSNGCC